MRNNPFLENIQVTGEGYIGRHEEIRELMDIFRKKGRDTGVVVSGLTRMGKTSLVKKCFRMAEEEGLLEENNIVTTCVTVSEQWDFSRLIKNLADNLNDALEERKMFDSYLEQKFKKVDDAFKKKGEDIIDDMDRPFTQILKRMYKNGIKAVVLLDEFDDAGRAFSYGEVDLSTNFQKFRGYASNADYNVTFILTSRSRISVIDASLPSGSNLRGVFSEKVLVGFTDVERIEFFEKMAECGAALTEKQKEEFIWYAGRSPFLFSKIACGILSQDERIPVAEISVPSVIERKRTDFEEYFVSLVDFMSRDQMLSKFVQVFFGPKCDLTVRDVKALLSYGYIYHDQNDKSFIDVGFTDKDSEENCNIYSYQTICPYFLEFVRFNQSSDNAVKIWAELINAENELRKVIRKGLEAEFGEEDWVKNLQDLARSQQKGYLYDPDKARAFIDNSRRDFGEKVEDNPLCVISINSLGNIICAFWTEHYQKVFDPPYKTMEALTKELEKLNRARNPLAHGNDYLTQEDKNDVTVCCKKIVNNLLKNGSGKRQRAGR